MNLTLQRRGHVGMHDASEEWSRYYHDLGIQGLEALHARFVGHKYPRHTHDYFVVALVENGAASYWYRGAQRVAPAGHVFVVNPGEPHTGESAKPGGYFYQTIYPQIDCLARVAADVGGSKVTPFLKGSVYRDARLAALLCRFHQALTCNAPTVACETLLLRALAHLITHYADPRVTPLATGREHPAVRRARDYIEAHFDEDISLSQLAALVSLSPYYFARSFERETGLPPHGYLENVRVRKARDFLDEGHSLASAALSAGYADQSHLTHRFKRFLGVTPGQYVREGKVQQDRRKSGLRK